MEMVQRKSPKVKARPAENGFGLELVLYLLVVLAVILADAFLFVFYPIEGSEVIEMAYSEGLTIAFTKGTLLFSLVGGALSWLLSLLLLLLLRPSGISPSFGAKAKGAIPYFILSLFGILAHVVLLVLLTGFGVPALLSTCLSGFLCSVYFILLYKLYLEGRTYSNSLFWEIFRFAIVGLVAAVFDFALCYVVQFIAFAGKDAVYVTILATACGFAVGVVINYLMSTFMVYKGAKTKTSRTGKGMALFFFLALIGLFLGIGLQALLYDWLFLDIGIHFFSYPVDFVIRTLVVMVYNYVTRKLLLYR